jgi:hypothetical protein
VLSQLLWLAPHAPSAQTSPDAIPQTLSRRKARGTAALENRIAALVADPGVVRVASSWEAHLAPELTAILDQGNKEEFDAIMTSSPDPAGEALVAWRMAPYGKTSVFDVYKAAREMTLDEGTVAQIRCPTLVADPDNEQFWPGQSRRLYEARTCDKQIARFTIGEGGDWHCEPAAQSLRDERVFDFLEEVLG